MEKAKKIKIGKPLTVNVDEVREIVEKAFSKAAVDKDMNASLNKLSDNDLKEISEKAFAKAAVDKDLPEKFVISPQAVREIVEKAYTKAAVDKDEPSIRSKLTDKDLTEIARSTLKSKK